MGWYVYRLGNSSSQPSGKRVTVRKTASKYSPTSKASSIADFVKGNSWKVIEEQPISYSYSNREYLIVRDNGEIIGWILSQDIEGGYGSDKVGGGSSKDSRNFAIGTKVKIRATASHYQTGQSIPSSIKGTAYTVMQKKTVNQSNSTCAYLLKEIMSWVLVQDLDQSGSSTPSTPSGLKGENLPNSGTYKFTTNTNIRAGAGTQYAVVGYYNKGQSVNYSGKVVSGGYVWLAYKGRSGNTRYVAVL